MNERKTPHFILQLCKGRARALPRLGAACDGIYASDQTNKESIMDKRYWSIQVIFIAIGIALLMVMLTRLFETASANPILLNDDAFEFNWPSQVVPPELLELQCSDQSGSIVYMNKIECNGSSCTGNKSS